MSIPAISAVAGGLPAVTWPTYLSSPPTAGAAGFASALGAIDQLQALQSSSDALAVQAVTGDLDDVHDYTIAASEAKVTLELTAALRNKAVEAFSEIMRMQA